LDPLTIEARIIDDGMHKFKTFTATATFPSFSVLKRLFILHSPASFLIKHFLWNIYYILLAMAISKQLLLVVLLGALICATNARKLVSQKGEFNDEKNFFHYHFPGFGGGLGGGGLGGGSGLGGGAGLGGVPGFGGIGGGGFGGGGGGGGGLGGGSGFGGGAGGGFGSGVGAGGLGGGGGGGFGGGSGGSLTGGGAGGGYGGGAGGGFGGGLP
jgi:hypothetical protein